MRIEARSYAYLRKYTARLPGGDLEVPEGATVEFVLNFLDVPEDLKKILLVNGRHVTENRVLSPGDVLVFYPVLEGG